MYKRRRDTMFVGGVACGMCLMMSHSLLSADPVPCFPGDMNVDGAVDMLDVGPFVEVILGQNTDPDALCAADLNGDAQADGGDIQMFTEYAVCGCGCGDGSHCDLGEACVGGFCQPTANADLEIGIGGFSIPGVCVSGPYTKVASGARLMLCEGFAGAAEMHLTLRTMGFDPGATVDVSFTLTFVNPQSCLPGGCAGVEFCHNGACTLGEATFTGLTLTDLGGGVGEIQNFSYPLGIAADALDGLDAILTVSVTDSNVSAISATQSVWVEMQVKEFCIGPTCPPGFECVDFFCEPIS